MYNILRIKLTKTIKPLLDLLRQGTSPQRLAASFALGAVIGIFPVVGTTTVICTGAAIVLRLNLPTIQIANYLVYPLQLVLLIPFVQLGAVVFQVSPPPLSAEELATLFSEDFWGTLVSFFAVIARATAAWILIALPFFTALFIPLRFLFKRIARRRENDVPIPGTVSERKA